MGAISHCHSASLKSADIIPWLILCQAPHYHYLLEGRFAHVWSSMIFFFFKCSIPVSLAALQRTFFVSLALEARVLAFQGLTGLQNQKDSCSFILLETGLIFGVLQSPLRAGFVHLLFILDKILALMTFAPGITPMNMLCYMGEVTLPL